MFMEARGGLIKLVSKNHQYLGVNNAIDALCKIEDNKGKLGVFWHTQGSGKSISMIFFAQKIFRKIAGNWTFVVITDRKELDGQIYKNFGDTGVITESLAQATSSANLRQLLTEDHRYVFSLIHKFRTETGQQHTEVVVNGGANMGIGPEYWSIQNAKMCYNSLLKGPVFVESAFFVGF